MSANVMKDAVYQARWSHERGEGEANETDAERRPVGSFREESHRSSGRSGSAVVCNFVVANPRYDRSSGWSPQHPAPESGSNRLLGQWVRGVQPRHCLRARRRQATGCTIPESTLPGPGEPPWSRQPTAVRSNSWSASHRREEAIAPHALRGMNDSRYGTTRTPTWPSTLARSAL
jgi:hypothetical protein